MSATQARSAALCPLGKASAALRVSLSLARAVHVGMGMPHWRSDSVRGSRREVFPANHNSVAVTRAMRVEPDRLTLAAGVGPYPKRIDRLTWLVYAFLAGQLRAGVCCWRLRGLTSAPEPERHM